MAEIVALARHRAAGARTGGNKIVDRNHTGSATLLLFTGVRREAIDAQVDRAKVQPKDRPVCRRGDADC